MGHAIKTPEDSRPSSGSGDEGRDREPERKSRVLLARSYEGREEGKNGDGGQRGKDRSSSFSSSKTVFTRLFQCFEEKLLLLFNI